MKFVTDLDPKKEPVCVTLEQDNDDVNILVNGTLVGWFSASREKFVLASIDKDDMHQLGRLQVEDEHLATVRI